MVYDMFIKCMWFSFLDAFFMYCVINVVSSLSRQIMVHYLSGTNLYHYHDSKIHGANMGLIWGRQGLGWPHFGPMNLGVCSLYLQTS